MALPGRRAAAGMALSGLRPWSQTGDTAKRARARAAPAERERESYKLHGTRRRMQRMTGSVLRSERSMRAQCSFGVIRANFVIDEV